jgi:hypothetical protein
MGREGITDKQRQTAPTTPASSGANANSSESSGPRENKERNMNRLHMSSIILILCVLLSSLLPGLALAGGSGPSYAEAMDEAYVEAYNQRAVERYESMLATAAAKRNTAGAAVSYAEAMDEAYLQAYIQRAVERYESIQSGPTVEMQERKGEDSTEDVARQ